jgi:hypothetical protein
MPNWIFNNFAFNVNPVSETCSSFIPSTQIYKLSSDGIRDMSFGFPTYFLGPYDKHDTFSDADKWGVDNEQWE